MNQNLLILDFDGVVCDGLNECLLTAWNTWHGLRVEDFDVDTLETIPDSFAARFAHCRNFVRHSGQFAVPFVFGSVTFTSGSEFDEAFGAIPADRIDSFVRRFEGYRVGVIGARYESWIGMHDYYDGMIDVLRNRADDVFIVSGKDTHSIKEILGARGIELPESRIFGSMRAKVPALERIASETGAQPDQMNFFDDNLSNVLEAHEAGYSAHWAGWGYKTEEDRRVAAVRNVPPVSLTDFVARFSESPGN